jgi:hypothetical protein
MSGGRAVPAIFNPSGASTVWRSGNFRILPFTITEIR